MLTVTLWTIHPADRFCRHPRALCVGSVTYGGAVVRLLRNPCTEVVSTLTPPLDAAALAAKM